MRRATFSSLAFLLLACGGGGGGGSTPSSPTPPPPPPPVPVTRGWSVAGQLIDTVSRQPIGGARIAPTWDLEPVTTDSSGSYELTSTTNPPTTPYRLAITGTDLVPREVWVSWERGPRTDVALEAIRNRRPFSMEFYRQFVRGAYDHDEIYSVLRWMESPKFYLKTVDQNGKAIEPEVVAVIIDALHRAVPAFTGGRLAVAALETGTESRPPAIGWINVEVRRDRSEHRVCGRAEVGANPGNIWFTNDLCSCGSNKVPGALVFHEVGHALGFFHVPDRRSVMYPFFPGSCPRGELSPAEQFHAAIAYSRPRGNMDPDIDPPSARAVTASTPTIVEYR